MAPTSESPASLFADYISQQIVQARCINCHVEGGVSGHTRLVLSPSTEEGHEALNLAAFESLIAMADDGADLILNKIQGVGHGGGIQVPAGSADFANMERFLRLLSGESSSGSGLSPQTLFEGVTMASPAKTLRRAALILAGRLPTQAEINSVNNGQVSSLRREIRDLMTGPGFHEFLIRASNDRLLTDRHRWNAIVADTAREFVELGNKQWELADAALAKGYTERWADAEYQQWDNAVQHGFSRAPLELIARIVENDLPYTEILTADYVMANPWAAEAYGATTQFENIEDPLEFKPSEIVAYYRNDDSKVSEFTLKRGIKITNPGNLATEYPHAGILNTTVFLKRYPTTATNRNRARSRWTYYHFLGVDIEKSAARTTDPDALADTDNPTMKNPACTVCHSVMDPVAGAFQNYGDEGLFRHKHGGLDSLADLYKYPEDGSATPYQEGDTWYRNMREPGFGSASAPSADNSLQWLAERIVADDRFAEATVKFWWPAVTGAEVLAPPEDSTDAGFEALLLASGAQALEVSRIAEAFRRGIAGGQPYNGRDLLVEIAVSPWFRAESIAAPSQVRAEALGLAGVERLLTPEELERKTESITGFVWGRRRRLWEPTASISFLGDRGRFNLLYGGIDSEGVTARSGETTPLMAAVAQSHAIQASCPIVTREFFLSPSGDRRLFDGIELNVAPDTAGSAAFDVTPDGYDLAQGQAVSLPLEVASAGEKTILFAYSNNYGEPPGGPGRDRRIRLNQIVVRDGAGTVVGEFGPDSFSGQDCGGPEDVHFGTWNYVMWAECSLALPFTFDAPGDFSVEVTAWQERAGPDPARLEVSVVESPSSAFDVRSKTWDTRETFSVRTSARDVKYVRVEFTNDYWEESGGRGHDRNLRLDRVVIRDSEGNAVETVEAESLAYTSCPGANSENGHFVIWSDCPLLLPLNPPSDGEYTVDVIAWQDAAGPDPARMKVDLVAATTESDILTETAWGAPLAISWHTNVRASSDDAIRISFTNEYWEEPGGRGHDRDLLLGRIAIRDSGGTVIEEIQPHFLRSDCGHQIWDRFRMDGACSLDIPVAFPIDGDYIIDVEAWQVAAGPDPARLELSILSDIANSRGSERIRQKLAALHEKLLGVTLSPDSPDVEEAYSLFVEVWKKRRESRSRLEFGGTDGYCRLKMDHFFYEDVPGNPLGIDEFGNSDLPWGDVYGLVRAHGVGVGDPSGTFRPWVVVLAFLLSDYRYLYL